MGSPDRNISSRKISFKSILDEIRSKYELDTSYNETIKHISSHFDLPQDYAKQLVDDTSIFD